MGTNDAVAEGHWYSRAALLNAILVDGGDWFQIRNRLCRDYQIIESSENNEGGVSIGSSLHVEVSQELQAKKYKQENGNWKSA